MPPNWRSPESLRQLFLRSQGWGWFTSPTNHYGLSGGEHGIGENRVKLSSCRILNYYSPQYASQSLERAKGERKKFNLTDDGFWLGPRNNGMKMGEKWPFRN
jgi:hypothetical protein